MNELLSRLLNELNATASWIQPIGCDSLAVNTMPVERVRSIVQRYGKQILSAYEDLKRRTEPVEPAAEPFAEAHRELEKLCFSANMGDQVIGRGPASRILFRLEQRLQPQLRKAEALEKLKRSHRAHIRVLQRQLDMAREKDGMPLFDPTGKQVATVHNMTIGEYLPPPKRPHVQFVIDEYNKPGIMEDLQAMFTGTVKPNQPPYMMPGETLQDAIERINAKGTIEALRKEIKSLRGRIQDLEEAEAVKNQQFMTCSVPANAKELPEKVQQWIDNRADKTYRDNGATEAVLNLLKKLPTKAEVNGAFANVMSNAPDGGYPFKFSRKTLERFRDLLTRHHK